MVIRDSHIIVVGMLGLTALIGGTLYWRWDADGPGTHGGGADLNRKVAAPMAAPDDQLPAAQRRRERATISGRVSDGDGAPLAGATVCATASSTLLGEADTRWPRCVDTGADGRYLIADLFGVQHRVSAGAAGHLPADYGSTPANAARRSVALRPGSAAQDVDVRLVRGGVEVRGRVMDLWGQPIAGARVVGGEADGDPPRVWGRAGADGGYALWVRPGAVTVQAHAPGMASGSVTGPSEGSSFPVYLAPQSTLRGRVLAVDGTPVEGVWVRASATGGATRTDAAGHYTIEALAPGVYTPWAESDDRFGMASEQVALGLGESSRLLVITARPAVFVAGRIVRGGAPCEAGTLRLREAASGREVRDDSGIDGAVHVRGLLPGTYAVGVTCDGLAEVGHPPLLVADKDVPGQTWDASADPGVGSAARPTAPPVRPRVRATNPAGVISGVVVDAAGLPLAGALVEARAEGAGVPASHDPPQFTDGGGGFTLGGLTGEAYTITVRPLGGGEARREHVKRGEAPVLTLVPGARVRGTVLTPGGGAPDSFTVEVIDPRSGLRRAENFIATAGAWGFDGLTAGSHEVRVRAREGAGVQTLTLAAGEKRDEFRVSLIGAATMRGTVVDLAGAPVPGLEVGLSSAKGAVWDMRDVTDAAGRFELTRVSTGPVFVTVGPPGGQASRYGQSRVAIDVPSDRPLVELPAIRVATRRIADGQARGDLGFTLAATVAGDDPLQAELEVATVRPTGAAARAGLLPRDRIVAVDEQDVRGTNRSLYATLTVVPAGTTVRLGLARGVTVAIQARVQR